jgi:uncharacterized protein YjiS (DUF1127 family)
MINKLIATLTNIRNTMDYNKKVRQTIRELSALSNYELNDIGISRGEIHHIAHTSYKKSVTVKADDVRVSINENLRGFV